MSLLLHPFLLSSLPQLLLSLLPPLLLLLLPLQAAVLLVLRPGVGMVAAGPPSASVTAPHKLTPFGLVLRVQRPRHWQQISTLAADQQGS